MPIGLTHFIPVWKQAPMLRLLPAIMLGIVCQWYLQIPLLILLPIFLVLLGGCIYFSKIAFLKNYLKYGISLQLLLVAVGGLLAWVNNTSNHPYALVNTYTDSAVVVATLQEPLVEKNKSYKALANVQVLAHNQLKNTKGQVIIYLQKDSNNTMPQLGYGNQLVFKKPLQAIANAGNPGGFDYKRYCAFHGIYYQIFLKQNEYSITNSTKTNRFNSMLLGLQSWVLNTFKKNIPGNKEAGVAEALLIGYRNDLDIDLVQSYSNTGVVHIIAISGMHLGLIYGLLVIVFMPLRKVKKIAYIRAFFIISILWIFSLLTGAAPSIIRSAIMFSFLVLGETQNQKASIYNNLAASALLILIYDPYSLWDVGFQLSYTAVLSIAIFATPINNLLTIKQKWLRPIWQLIAVTLAAQIITYPIVSYHFHQFPNLFLFTNIIAVPLSSIILYALILLLLISPIGWLAMWVGTACHWLIWVMNSFIEQINKIPFALTDGIYFTILQTACLLLFIAAISWWLMRKQPKAMVLGAGILAIFVTLRTYQYVQEYKLRKLIIYNVPQHRAIDIISGSNYLFLGDSVLKETGFLQNFHLKPSRVYHQIKLVDSLPNVAIMENYLQLGKKRVLIINNSFDAENGATQKLEPDLVLITQNPKIKLADILQIANTGIIVADATNSRKKMSQWQKEAEALHLRFHGVTTQGAFSMNW
jgi:competence protein ComEC